MIEIRWDADWDGLTNHKLLEEILKVFLKNLFNNERGLSLYLTNDAEIQKLNQQFRGKDSPTDILSWPYAEDETDADLPKVEDTDEKNSA